MPLTQMALESILCGLRIKLNTIDNDGVIPLDAFAIKDCSIVILHQVHSTIFKDNHVSLQ